MMTLKTPIEKWQWFGVAGHFIGSSNCLFHMTTRIGKYLVSSVGEYFPFGVPTNGWTWADVVEVGLGRKYETMVFKIGKVCRDPECNCRRPEINPRELTMLPANRRGDAQKNHIKLCLEYASK